MIEDGEEELQDLLSSLHESPKHAWMSQLRSTQSVVANTCPSFASLENKRLFHVQLVECFREHSYKDRTNTNEMAGF